MADDGAGEAVRLLAKDESITAPWPLEAKLNLWMKRNGMMKSSCEGITVKHLLTTSFRDHLPGHLTGKGSIAKIATLLKTISWISVFDYHGEAAFRYSGNLSIIESDDSSNKGKVQEQLPWRPKHMQRQKTDDKACSDGVTWRKMNYRKETGIDQQMYSFSSK